MFYSKRFPLLSAYIYYVQSFFTNPKKYMDAITESLNATGINYIPYTNKFNRIEIIGNYVQGTYKFEGKEISWKEPSRGNLTALSIANKLTRQGWEITDKRKDSVIIEKNGIYAQLIEFLYSKGRTKNHEDFIRDYKKYNDKRTFETDLQSLENFENILRRNPKLEITHIIPKLMIIQINRPKFVNSKSTDSFSNNLKRLLNETKKP